MIGAELNALFFYCVQQSEIACAVWVILVLFVLLCYSFQYAIISLCHFPLLGLIIFCVFCVCVTNSLTLNKHTHSADEHVRGGFEYYLNTRTFRLLSTLTTNRISLPYRLLGQYIFGSCRTRSSQASRYVWNNLHPINISSMFYAMLQCIHFHLNFIGFLLSVNLECCQQPRQFSIIKFDTNTKSDMSYFTIYDLMQADVLQLQLLRFVQCFYYFLLSLCVGDME